MSYRWSQTPLMVAIFTTMGCGYQLGGKKKQAPPATSQAAIQGFTLDSLERYQSCVELQADLRERLLVQLKYSWDQAQWQNSHDTRKSKKISHTSAKSLGGATASVDAPSKSESTASDQDESDDSDKSNKTSASKVDTNLQVQGVDEPDMIKVSDHYLYIANNQINLNTLDIAVVSKQPLQQIDKILIPNFQDPQLYTVGDYFVVTGQDLNNASFSVKVYDTKEKAKLLYESSFKSQPVDSRMIGTKLFVVLREELQQKRELPHPGLVDLQGSFNQFASKLDLQALYDFGPDHFAGISCTAMIKIPVAGDRLQFQRVIAYDVAQGQIVDEVAIPGNDLGIYMTDAALYSYGGANLPEVWIDPRDQLAQQAQRDATLRASETLVIKKVSLDAATGKLSPQAIGTVNGRLKEFNRQWAFHEMTHNNETLLSVVTTTGELDDRFLDDSDAAFTNPASNHLTVLRQTGSALETAALLADFGTKEDVRSVRYVGPYAYVVTFKKTDPLFTIDLQNPLEPKIVGELKIPGFSLYLQPHGQNRLLGLGYQTEESPEVEVDQALFQGVLFQLFDVSNPAATSRLNFVELGQRGSYSEANQDHHAFYYDAENSLAGIPVVLFDDGSATRSNIQGSAERRNGRWTHENRSFSGAVFYRIGEQDLKEVKRVSHYKYLGPICRSNLQPLFWTDPIVANPEVRRMFRDGNTVYAVSNYAVSTFDTQTLADLASTPLDRNDCSPQFRRESSD